jgi:hypothetical protein
MNLLLLFSALLSALTGVNVGGARVPVAAEQVVRTGAAVAAAAHRPALTARPANVVAPVAALLQAAAVVRLPVVSIPAYASRRRE